VTTDVTADAAELIDLIYEAAFVPEHWEAVLQKTSDLSASASAQVFFVSDHSRPRGVSLANMRPLFEAFIQGDAWTFCDSMRRMNDLQPASFVHVDDFLSADEIERDPGRIMLRQAGIGAHLCTVVAMPTGELAMFVLQKWLRDGGYDRQTIARLDPLRPHLARASLIASRLRAERAHAAVAALERLGLPAAVVRHKGQVLAANAGFEGLLDTLFVTRAFGGVALRDASANRLLAAAFEAAGRPGDGSPLVASIPVAAQADQPPHVVHVVPLRRSARDVFTGGECLMVVNPIDRRAGLPSNALAAALFDLSPAEARLALRLAAGVPLAQAGPDCGLSSASARTYLARVFSKTGTHSQHQLVALLRSAGPLG
jgi:DNA-binding CsgD family transcriptional regulator